MKVFFGIIRWLIALGIASFMTFFVIVAIPMSVFGSQLLNSSSAMRWVNAVTADKKAMDSFTAAFLTGIGNTNSSSDTDPVTRQVLATMGNPNTALGASTRKVITGDVVAKNIKVNATSFYDWLDAKTPTLKFTFYVGGTQADQQQMVTELIKTRYEALPTCTASQIKDIINDETATLLTVPCSSGPLSPVAAKTEAQTILNAKEIKPYLNTGVPWVTNSTESNRKSVLAVGKLLRIGLVVTWVVVAVSVLFMLLLFTPAGVNFIMTGLVVGSTGLMVTAMGGSSFALLGKVTPYASAGESIAEAFGKTLGAPISLQGALLMGIGFMLVVIGIVVVFRKRPAKKEVLTQSVSTVSTPTVATTPSVSSEPVKTTPAEAPKTEVAEPEKAVEKPKQKSSEK